MKCQSLLILTKRQVLQIDYFLLRPRMAIKPASINAEIMIAVTAPPAADTGRPGEGVGVGGRSFAVEVDVEVGQGVMVGGMVGVEVGWVGVTV